jgi:hypothetical protein
MTDVLEQVSVALQKAAIDGTLTKDAIDHFNGIVQDNEQLLAENRKFRADLIKMEDTLKIVQQERDTARADRDMLAQFHEGVKEREKKITELELGAAHQAQRVVDHQQMMAVIFKPGELRRDSWKSIPGFDSNGYPAGTQGNENGSETEHDE